MNLRLKPYDLILKTFVCLCATFIVHNAHAQTEEDGVVAETAAVDEGLVEDYRPDETGLVELHYPIDADMSYKERRPTSAFTFAFSYENFYPSKYTSIIDPTKSYQDLFGTSEMEMLSMELGYKYNFVLGSLIAGVGFGGARLFEPTFVPYRSLEFIKTTAHIGYVMDSLFDEPYLAPYVEGGTLLFSITETADEKSESGTTDTAFFYKAGALIQLNWIEDAVARVGLIDYGLQNTFIDVYAIQYATSINEEDVDTESTINYGIGLRLEF